MQRASGQYDHLTRVPRTGPRQSCGRRSFAPRHRSRATPRRFRGMEPTVRNPRIESAIGCRSCSKPASAGDSRAPAGQFRIARAEDPGVSSPLSRPFPNAGRSVAVLNSVAGNGIFGWRDRRPKIHPRDRYCLQRPGTLKIGGKIPAETASFRSTTVSAVREDWMVVCAVICEPVSPVSTLFSPVLPCFAAKRGQFRR